MITRFKKKYGFKDLYEALVLSYRAALRILRNRIKPEIGILLGSPVLFPPSLVHALIRWICRRENIRFTACS